MLALTLTAWRVLLLLYPLEREAKTVNREAIERELRSMGPPYAGVKEDHSVDGACSHTLAH